MPAFVIIMMKVVKSATEGPLDQQLNALRESDVKLTALLVKHAGARSGLNTLKADHTILWTKVLVASAAALGAILGVVLFLGVRQARKFIRPLNELAAATDRVRKGDLDVKVVPSSRDEVGQLTVSFNRMVREMRGRTKP